jgi:hypothetical protein
MASIAELLERDCVVHIDATIPAEMTIAEWRRVRTRLRPTQSRPADRSPWLESDYRDCADRIAAHS